MSKQYTWATNLMKLNRAIANAKGEGEAKIKELYVSYGGLLDKSYEKAGEIAEAMAQETMKEPEIVSEVTSTPVPESISETTSTPVVEVKKKGKNAK